MAYRIGFRVDAAPTLGGGHVMRCLTLARRLRTAGHECRFLCSPETLDVIPPEMWDGFPVFNETEPVPSAFFDLLIFDHYGIDREEETAWRPNVRAILVIDDLANRPHDCDLLLDQNYNADAEAYRDLVPDDTRILLGTGFALLRQEFADRRPDSLERRAPTAPVRRLLVSLGMTDVGGIAARIGGILQDVANLERIDMVVSSKAPSHARLIDIQASDPRFHILGDVKDMAELMLEADVAIGAGGTTSWERCAMGLPCLLLVLADNQIHVARELSDAGAVISLGDVRAADDTTLGTAIRAALSDPDALHRTGQRAAAVCDGHGADRVVAEIEAALSRTRPVLRQADVVLRPARLDDCKDIWLWRNDPAAVAASLSGSEVSWDIHAGWFPKTLERPDISVFVAEFRPDGDKLGMVRFDRRDAATVEISINLNPAHRGQGLGRCILTAAITAMADNDELLFIARVKVENVPSRRLFDRTGFRCTGEVEGVLSYEYRVPASTQEQDG